MFSLFLGDFSWRYQIITPEMSSLPNIEKFLMTILYLIHASLYNEGHENEFLTLKHSLLTRNKVLKSNLEEVTKQIGGEFRKADSIENILMHLRACRVSIMNENILLDIQITIIHAQSAVFLQHIPNQFDSSKRQIFLACQTSDVSLNNTYFAVPHIRTLFQKYGVFCFFCQKYFTSKGCQHKCKYSMSCFACRRVFLTNETYTTLETKDLFCNGMLSKNTETVCEICNVTVYTNECREHHKKKVCRWGWKCLKCNIYQSRNKYFKSQTDIADKHKCGNRICNYCGEQKQEYHFCSLQKPTLKNEYTNLAFINFEYSGYNPGKCKKCYLSSDICDFCKKGYSNEKPVVCSILQEEESRESFSAHILFDNLIEEKNNLKEHRRPKLENFLIKSYWPKGHKPKLAPEGQQTRFSKRKTQYKLPNVFVKENMTLVDKLLDYLLKNNFSNSSIIVHSQDLFFILQGLHANGFTPNIVKKESQIMLVEEKVLGFRFVEAANYINVNLSQIALQHNLKFTHFPQRWIHPNYYNYCGKPPNEDDFFSFQDTESDSFEKHLIANKLATETVWEFFPRLAEYTIENVVILAVGILDFLLQAFDAQIVLQRHLQPNKEVRLLHPINTPVFTAPTYAFHMFMHFSPTANQIKSVKKEIYYRSSKGEVEYTSYLKWKFSDQNIRDSWSPMGQQDFQITRPDASSGSNIWFFNGCFYHGHDPAECLFKSKADKTKQASKLALFNKKVNLLKEAHPNLQVSTMWECQWRLAKRKNSEIIYFLSNYYRSPPPYRLNPRDAGNIQLNFYTICGRSKLTIHTKYVTDLSYTF